MSKTNTEFVITADNAKAMKAAVQLLSKVNELGPALNNVAKNGEQAFNAVSISVKSVADMMGIGGMMGLAVKAVSQYLDDLKAKAEAVTAEIQRASNVNASSVTGIGEIQANQPGMSGAQLQQVDRALKDIASQSAIGDKGLEQLQHAMATTIGAVKDLPLDKQIDIIKEAAQTKELYPNVDMSAVALGYGKIMQGADYKISANEAQNTLAWFQSEALEPDITKTAQQVPQLSQAAKDANIVPRQMYGMAAWAQQAAGISADEATTVVVNMAEKLMANRSEVESTLGIAIDGKNLTSALSSIRQGMVSGEVTPDEMMKAFPKIGARGASGMTIIGALKDERQWDEYQRIVMRDALNDVYFKGTDIVADDIKTRHKTIPGSYEQAELARTLSANAVARSDDIRGVLIDTQSAALKDTLEREKRTEGYVKHTMNIYRADLINGWPEEKAEKHARWFADQVGWSKYLTAGLSTMISPLIYGAASERMSTGEIIKWDPNTGKQTESKFSSEQHLAAISDKMDKLNGSIQAQTERRTTPRSTLATGANL